MKSYAIILTVAAIVTLPLLSLGITLAADDAVGHLLYHENFARQLWSGDLYPRWLSEINAGYGSPTFFYYPPLLYYMTSVLRPLPIDIEHQLGLATSIILALSGITGFLWMKEIAPERAALCGALVYLLLPYHTLIDIYRRAALTEVLAFVWMPLVLFSVSTLARGRGVKAVPILAASYAALCLSHALTTLIFSPIPVCYAAIISDGRKRLTNIALTAAGLALGLGVSASFLLPASSYTDFIHADRITSGMFHFEQYLLTTQSELRGAFWLVFQVGLTSIVCFAAIRRGGSAERTREAGFWLVVAMCAIFMTLHASHFIWTWLPVLQLLQFPWRFNSILSVAALPLITLAVSFVRRPLRLLSGMVVFVLSVYCINWLSDIRVESNRKYFQPPLKVIEEARQRLNSRLDTVVLLPRTVAGDIWEKLDDLEDGGVKATFTKGTGAAKILSARPREIELEITSEDGGYVTVSQLFFPGWTAGIDGTPTVLAVEPDEIGLVRISAPPGNNLVRLRLQKLNAEFYGDIISVVSLVALFGLLALNSPLR